MTGRAAYPEGGENRKQKQGQPGIYPGAGEGIRKRHVVLCAAGGKECKDGVDPMFAAKLVVGCMPQLWCRRGSRKRARQTSTQELEKRSLL